MKQKPDAAARLADWIDSIANADFDKTGERPYWLPLKVYEGLQRRIRSLIRREVRKERERMIALAEAQRQHELRTRSTRVGAFALDDLIDKMKGPK